MISLLASSTFPADYDWPHAFTIVGVAFAFVWWVRSW